MKLLLPLKYYDEAGRIKPSYVFYLCLIFLCRSILILLGSVSAREDSSQLLLIFYPGISYLYTSLAIAIPAFLTVILVSFREKIWQQGHDWLFAAIKPLLGLAILTDILFHLFLAEQNHWQFSWTIGLVILIDNMCLYFVIADRHLSAMLKDWRSTITKDSTK